MKSPKSQEPQQPKIVIAPKSSAGNVAETPDNVSSQDRIRELAYELYESRGRVLGQDQQDWFRAEQEILERER